MRKIISIVNQKGGVGKSTISVNLAVYYAKKGKKVLLIDTDPQSSSSDFRALRAERDDLVQFAAIQVQKPTLHKDIDSFDFEICIIDVAGRENQMQRNAMRVSDIILVPSTPSGFDLWSSEDTFQKISELKEFKENVKAYAFYNLCRPGGTKLMEEAILVQQEIQENYNIEFLKSHIYNREVYRKAVIIGLSISEMNDEKAQNEFQLFCEEVEAL